jgi:hypothetical protein
MDDNRYKKHFKEMQQQKDIDVVSAVQNLVYAMEEDPTLTISGVATTIINSIIEGIETAGILPKDILKFKTAISDKIKNELRY